MIAPLFCPQSLDNLSIKIVKVYSAAPFANDLISGTQTNGIVKIDTNEIKDKKILGYTLYAGGTTNIVDYATGTMNNNTHFHFKRDSEFYGFSVYAIITNIL